MTRFRKILLFILIISLIDVLIFKAPLYPLSYSELKKESNELSKERYLEMQHLPLIFIHKQKITESIKSVSESPLLMVFGVCPLNIGASKFVSKTNMNNIVLGQLIPIFLRVRSLRN